MHQDLLVLSCFLVDIGLGLLGKTSAKQKYFWKKDVLPRAYVDRACQRQRRQQLEDGWRQMRQSPLQPLYLLLVVA